MVKAGGGKPSYLAMFLSLILPGLGQIYLRRWLKGIVLFFGVALGATLIYLNSLPVHGWHDLANFDGFTEWWEKRRFGDADALQSSNTSDTVEDGENGTVYHLWTFENGKKLMYRPSWKLKLSGLVQGLFVWLYAIFDAWRGEKGFNKRAFKTRLRRVKEQEEVEESGN